MITPASFADPSPGSAARIAAEVVEPPEDESPAAVLPHDTRAVGVDREGGTRRHDAGQIVQDVVRRTQSRSRKRPPRNVPPRTVPTTDPSPGG